MRVNSTAVQFRRRGTPSFLFSPSKGTDARVSTSPSLYVRNVILSEENLPSSRVVDARSMNAPKLTSQPANVAQRNSLPEETNAGTVITFFDGRLGELFSTHYRKELPQRCPDRPKSPELHIQPQSLCYDVTNFQRENGTNSTAVQFR